MGIVAKLRTEIKARQDRIEEIQAACPHPNTVVEWMSTSVPVPRYERDEYGEDIINRNEPAFKCRCGFCESEWIELEDGTKWSQFMNPKRT